jgi:type VI secretion system FHA domain protein
MPLTLKIISKQRHILGADSLCVFSVHGGSIGRAPDNDWVLPDPDRYISGHHASIDYRGGAYYLRDNSTNGVFVNHSDEPVGRGTPIRLYDGDELRMGDYLFEVSIVNVSRDGTDDSGDVAPEDGPERRIRRRKPAGPLSLKLLGDEADQLQEAAREVQFADTVRMPDEEVEQQLQDGAFERTVVGGGGVVFEPPEEAVPSLAFSAPAAAALKDPPATDGRDFLAAVRLLLESAGLDASRLQPGNEQETVVTAGRLIRAMTEGLQHVLRTRTLIKSQLQIDQSGMQPAGNNPLKLMPTAQEALEQLFYGDAEGYLGPLESTEKAFHDLRTHQSAMVRAMQFAFRDLLEKLDPDRLEDRFEGNGTSDGGAGPGARLGGLFSRATKQQKPHYWEQYRETFQQITSLNDDLLLKMVRARFAEAYAAEVQYLESRKTRSKNPTR